jgi:hypothetical protein
MGISWVKWSTEEDAKLTKAVKKHCKAWVAVAARVPGGRTNKGGDSRWVTYLELDEDEHTAGSDEALASVPV